MPAPARWTLPDHPDLGWLRRRAKELRDAAASGEAEALDLVAAERCRWLLARGADRTALDARFDATPAGWAAHAGHDDLAVELDPG